MKIFNIIYFKVANPSVQNYAVESSTSAILPNVNSSNSTIPSRKSIIDDAFADLDTSNNLSSISAPTVIQTSSTTSNSTTSSSADLVNIMFNSVASNPSKSVSPVTSIPTNTNLPTNLNNMVKTNTGLDFNISTQKIEQQPTLTISSNVSNPEEKRPVIDKTDDKRRKSIQSQIKAKVLYSRAAGGKNELSINAGDILSVIKQESDWWWGCPIDEPNKLGFFPGNYVEIVPDIIQPPSYIPAVPPSYTPSIPTQSNSMSFPSNSSQQSSNLVQLGIPGANLQQQNPYNQGLSLSNQISTPAQSNLGIPGGNLQQGIPGVSLQQSNPYTQGINKPLQIAGARTSTHGNSSNFVRFDIDASYLGKPCPIWQQYFYWDLFGDGQEELKAHRDFRETIPIQARMFHSLHVLRSSLKSAMREDQTSEDMKRLLAFAGDAFNDAADICARIPAVSADANNWYEFLQYFMSKVVLMRPGDVLILPVMWKINETDDHAILMMLRRSFEGNDRDFCVSIINTRVGGGLEYHPSNINVEDGSINYNISMEFKNVPQARILSTTYW